MNERVVIVRLSLAFLFMFLLTLTAQACTCYWPAGSIQESFKDSAVFIGTAEVSERHRYEDGSWLVRTTFNVELWINNPNDNTTGKVEIFHPNANTSCGSMYDIGALEIVNASKRDVELRTGYCSFAGMPPLQVAKVLMSKEDFIAPSERQCDAMVPFATSIEDYEEGCSLWSNSDGIPYSSYVGEIELRQFIRDNQN